MLRAGPVQRFVGFGHAALLRVDLARFESAHAAPT
jgi:hypothetical protein